MCTLPVPYKEAQISSIAMKDHGFWKIRLEDSVFRWYFLKFAIFQCYRTNFSRKKPLKLCGLNDAIVSCSLVLQGIEEWRTAAHIISLTFARSKKSSHVKFVIIYYLYTWVLKEIKPPHSPRGSRNSHINPKMRRIHTVGFYEDLKV
jgi:hypothetical protein